MMKPLMVVLVSASVRLACSILVPTVLGLNATRCSTLRPGFSGSSLEGTARVYEGETQLTPNGAR